MLFGKESCCANPKASVYYRRHTLCSRFDVQEARQESGSSQIQNIGTFGYTRGTSLQTTSRRKKSKTGFNYDVELQILGYVQCFSSSSWLRGSFLSLRVLNRVVLVEGERDSVHYDTVSTSLKAI
jgi:hypothetical protein